MKEGLLKLALKMDYFLKKEMTKDDAAKLNALLDAQGIPRHPKGVDINAKFHYQDEPEMLSGRQRFVDHLKRHKGKYGLGAAGLAGIAYLLRGNKQPQMIDPSMQDPQAGF